MGAAKLQPFRIKTGRGIKQIEPNANYSQSKKPNWKYTGGIGIKRFHSKKGVKRYFKRKTGKAKIL